MARKSGERRFLENLFLDYANYSLKDNPENLHIIFSEVLECLAEQKDFPPFDQDEMLKVLITLIIYFMKVNDRTIAGKYYKEIVINVEEKWHEVVGDDERWIKTIGEKAPLEELLPQGKELKVQLEYNKNSVGILKGLAKIAFQTVYYDPGT
ncbi:MAG: hypothetical protein ACFFCW_40370, partial [Candidatus Hodarchaeota archaeon]